MIRSAGSVPDGRTSTRPPAPSRACGGGDGTLQDRVRLPLVLVTDAHGALLLGQERDPLGELGEAQAGRRDHPQDLERRHDAVAARRVLPDDHVAALLATEPGAGHLHPVEDVLVPDRRPDDGAAGALDGLLEAAVREHGDDERRQRVGRAAAAVPLRARRSSARTPRIRSPSTTVPVAVDGHAAGPRRHRARTRGRRRLRDPRRQRDRAGRTAAQVDVQPIRVDR